MTGLYLGGNRYEAHIVHLGDFSQPDASKGNENNAEQTDRPQQQSTLQQIEAAYVEALSCLCRYAPYNWFNFYRFWQSSPSTETRATSPANTHA